MRKVAINDVDPYCYLRPPDTMPLLTLKILGAPRYQRLNVDSFIYIHYAAPPYSAGIVTVASVYGGWLKIPVPLFRHSHSLVELKLSQNKQF